MQNTNRLQSQKKDPSQLLNFIQDEHPQTIAMILSYLTAAQAAMVLGALPPEKQADVAKRIAMMDRTSPDVIKEVERVLERRLSSLVNQDYTIVGGVDAIVNILNTVDRSTSIGWPSPPSVPPWNSRSWRHRPSTIRRSTAARWKTAWCPPYSRREPPSRIPTCRAMMPHRCSLSANQCWKRRGKACCVMGK